MQVESSVRDERENFYFSDKKKSDIWSISKVLNISMKFYNILNAVWNLFYTAFCILFLF